jgi:hypothetical protein
MHGPAAFGEAMKVPAPCLGSGVAGSNRVDPTVEAPLRDHSRQGFSCPRPRSPPGQGRHGRTPSRASVACCGREASGVDRLDGDPRGRRRGLRAVPHGRRASALGALHRAARCSGGRLRARSADPRLVAYARGTLVIPGGRGPVGAQRPRRRPPAALRWSSGGGARHLDWGCGAPSNGWTDPVGRAYRSPVFVGG